MVILGAVSLFVQQLRGGTLWGEKKGYFSHKFITRDNEYRSPHPKPAHYGYDTMTDEDTFKPRSSTARRQVFHKTSSVITGPMMKRTGRSTVRLLYTHDSVCVGSYKTSFSPSGTVETSCTQPWWAAMGIFFFLISQMAMTQTQTHREVRGVITRDHKIHANR